MDTTAARCLQWRLTAEGKPSAAVTAVVIHTGTAFRCEARDLRIFQTRIVGVLFKLRFATVLFLLLFPINCVPEWYLVILRY